ncbi:MAG: hypothetical protein ABI609_05390 [Acidobacteriota bacterium]
MSVEDRARILRSLGAAGSLLPELLAYTENPYQGRRQDVEQSLPLGVEAQLDAWRTYAEEARSAGVVETLRRRLVQLRFPVEAGISQYGDYRAATRRGEIPPDNGLGLVFADADGIQLTIEGSIAGPIPVLVTRAREDFVTLVRALAGRNEPIDVPPSMGACLVKGLTNWHRVALHRERWQQQRGEGNDSRDGEAAWSEEFQRLAAHKELYQDRLLLLSSGPYSNVPAQELGLPADAWRVRSLRIRREHEAFHYLTLRLYGQIRSNLLDELLADLAGLLAADSAYSPELALRFLGTDHNAQIRTDARLRLYVGEPPLSTEAVAVLAHLAVRASHNLARVATDSGRDFGDPLERTALLLALADGALEELADEAAIRDRAQFASELRVCLSEPRS